MNIVMYTKANCPNCVSAKNLLKSKGLEWEEFEIEHYSAAFENIAPIYKIRQLPAIFINGQYVGGFAGLQAALKQLGV